METQKKETKEMKQNQKDLELISKLNRLIRYMNQDFAKEGIQILLANAISLYDAISCDNIELLSIDHESKRLIKYELIKNIYQVRELDGLYTVWLKTKSILTTKYKTVCEESVRFVEISKDCLEMSAATFKKINTETIIDECLSSAREHKKKLESMIDAITEVESMVSITIGRKDGAVYAPIYPV